ncbi:MAG: hypothetical protein NTV04_08450 [Deltaproteobacteria bacterium]|nr:hypothetical protein [Deltaproteobacteria bacterium]
MSLFKKISGFFAGSKASDRSGSFEIAVQCSRCGEVIRTRIDMTHDLSAEYGEDEQETYYLCRKVLIGKQGCYAPIEIILNFDGGRNLIDRQITGGKFAAGEAEMRKRAT